MESGTELVFGCCTRCLRAHVSSRFGWPCVAVFHFVCTPGLQELELAGKPMADPFSLSDYPALKASRANDPVRVVLRRVVPSDGEGDDADLPDDAPAAKGGDSDYDDESFDE